jgi:cysteine peptidase C11 family protein
MTITLEKLDMIRLMMLTAALLSASSLTLSQPTSSNAEWTVLVFMNGDNNLERDALINFAQMARVGSTDKVNIIVQFDRITKYAHTSPVDWSQTLRFKITKDMEPQPKNALADMGELNMGAPKTLEEFVRWGVSQYPAKHYFLILWDHGQGYRVFLRSLLARQRLLLASRGLETKDALSSLRAASVQLRNASGVATEENRTAPFRSAPGDPYRSVSNDETDNNVLYNREVVEALTNALGDRKLDLVGFDACLMAMVETAYALRNVGSNFVGSEDLEPGLGWKYDEFLDRLIANPSQSAAELAASVVDSYRTFYSKPDMLDLGGNETTLSAYRLAGISDLAAAISSLSDTLMANLDSELQNIIDARAATSVFAPGYSFYHVDIVQFVSELTKRTKNETVRARAQTVRERVTSEIFAKHAGSERQGTFGSFGLAIYFPSSAHEHTNDPYAQGGYEKDNQLFPVDFVQKERWSDFLHAFWKKVP